MPKNKSSPKEPWEKELLAIHRWGRFKFWFGKDDNRGEQELAKLKKLWKEAQPLSNPCKTVIEQIQALEICNWNLEQSILALCDAIGEKEPSKLQIGHMASVSEERWKKVQVYYLTLKNWLFCKKKSGYDLLLKKRDPDREIQNYIFKMLGDDRNLLKKLYVERLCLCLERWLGNPDSDSSRMKVHEAAVTTLEKEIKKLDPKYKVVSELVLKSDGDGRLQPCNHKAFKRYDLIISSIGAGKWRAGKEAKGTDGLERTEIMEKYLSPIELWISGKTNKEKSSLPERIHKALGKPDKEKLFLASLLLSLLRSQQLAAKKLAETRTKK